MSGQNMTGWRNGIQRITGSKSATNLRGAIFSGRGGGNSPPDGKPSFRRKTKTENGFHKDAIKVAAR